MLSGICMCPNDAPFQLVQPSKDIPLYTEHCNAEHLISPSVEWPAQTVSTFQGICIVNQSHRSGYGNTVSTEHTVCQLYNTLHPPINVSLFL
jgi:hypothetical protein